MKIATYNVNGVNGRLPVLLRWLDMAAPDIVCLQELKASDDRFPVRELEKAGYAAIWHGQKSWNGVAILARGTSIHETRRGLPGDPDDSHSRYLEGAVNGVLVGCLYLPNGNPQPGPKFDYKLAWFERLQDHARHLLAERVPVVLAGDYNVIATDLDALHPQSWVDDALFQPQPRQMYRDLVAQASASDRADLHLLGLSAPSLGAQFRFAHRPSAAEPSTGAPLAGRRRGSGGARLGENVGPRAGLDRIGAALSLGANFTLTSNSFGARPRGCMITGL